MKKAAITVLGLAMGCLVAAVFLFLTWNLYVPQDIVGSSVKTKQTDIAAVTETWFQNFFKQYKGYKVPLDYRITDYGIQKITLLNKKDSEVELDYLIKPASPNQALLSYYSAYEVSPKRKGWYGAQVVLKFQKTSDGYTVQNKMSPVQYQIQTDPTIREPQTKHYALADKEDTYFFDNQKLYVTYDKGQTSQEVPVSYDDAAKTNNDTYNELLPAHGYIVSKAFTAFVFYDNEGSYLFYSTNQGASWEKSRISAVHYRSENIYLEKTNTGGYVTLAVDRSLGNDYYATFKTTDFKTWTVLKGEVLDDKENVVFLDNNIGYIGAGKDKQNNLLVNYTQDDGATYRTLVIPGQPVDVLGSTIYPYEQLDYVYQENGKTYMVAAQGQDGDYGKNGVLAKALYESSDGINFTFVKEVYESPKLAG